MVAKILTDEAIKLIREAGVLRRTLSNKMLARKYNVSPCTIKNVIHEETYLRKLRRKRKSL